MQFRRRFEKKDPESRIHFERYRTVTWNKNRLWRYLGLLILVFLLLHYMDKF